MRIDAKTVEEYLEKVPEERQEVMNALRDAINENLPEGFQECMSYGMIGWVVPLSTYPDGYHCKPELPLPFMNLASQKNHMAVYHSGVYADPKLLKWFESEYAKRVPTKLNMGKSCVRFKKPEQVPVDLIGELCTKMTVQDWIDLYEKNVKK